jgi:hypothetical protein
MREYGSCVMKWHLIVLVIHVVSTRAVAGDRPDLLEKAGARVQNSIMAACVLPPESRVTYDVSGADWATILQTQGYKWQKTRAILSRPDQFTAQKISWRGSGEGRTGPLTGILVVGKHGDNDAFRGLCQLMGVRSSMAFGPKSFTSLDGGPGDFCVVSPNKLTGTGGETVVRYWLAFRRGNVAVLLESATPVNLLPIARVLDTIVANCPRSTLGAKTED